MQTEIYELVTEQAKLAVRIKGAELASWQPDKCHEFLHQPDAQWSGQAPLLFPFVGGLQAKSYTWQGKKYTMPKHGFLKERVFTYEADKSYQQAEQACLCLSYTSTAADLELYPFSFKVEAYFYLLGKSLRQALKIYNLSPGSMPFAAGFHPAFNLPKQLGSLEDFALRFPKRSELKRLQLNFASGLQLPLADTVLPLQAGVWQWQVADFAEQCWFFNTGGTELELIAERSQQAILHLQSDLPILGVWQPYRADKGADFICLEPWSSSVGPELEQGIADLADLQDRLCLAPATTCTLSYTATALI